MAGITQERAVKASLPLSSLKKGKLGFIEKIKGKDFKVRHTDN